MGKILVRKQQTGLAPEIAGGAERSGSQLFTGQGGIQSFIDPTRRDLSEIEGSTLGVYPSHFTHPDTGQVHEHPLAGQAIINPNAGQSKYGKLKPAMWGSRALGAGLGAYSALMSFAGDDDQDALSSGLNALGAGYNSYAATAPIEQMMGRVADRGQARRASDISTRDGASAVGVNQAARKVGQPSAAFWPQRQYHGGGPVAVTGGSINRLQPVNIFSPGGKGNQPRGKINVFSAQKPLQYTPSGHAIPIPKVTGPFTTISRPTVPIPPVDESGITIKPRDDTSTEATKVAVTEPEEMSDFDYNEYLKEKGFNYKEGENPFG